VTADETVLLRRYTESRRRHPLAPQGRVIDGVLEERTLTAPLRDAADLLIDTTELPIASLRALVERHFGGDSVAGPPPMAVTLISFAYPLGLPRDADLVFDARFLRNPHYDPMLRSRTGLDPEVAAYIEMDPDFAAFLEHVAGLLELLLPRFVQEGKKYVTIAVGCTGGRHRSVHIVERLAARLASRLTPGDAEAAWRVHVAHRELTRGEQTAVWTAGRPEPRRDGMAEQAGERNARSSPMQAQEA
jgi:RNase adapter protein RapZ